MLVNKMTLSLCKTYIIAHGNFLDSSFDQDFTVVIMGGYVKLLRKKTHFTEQDNVSLGIADKTENKFKYTCGLKKKIRSILCSLTI